MLFVLILLLAAALVAVPLTGQSPRRAGLLLALAPGAGLGYLLARAAGVVAGEAVDVELAWIPALEVALDLRLDALGLVFGLLVCGMGVATMVYAGAYLQGDARLGRLYSTLLVFTAAMLGVVWADDLVTLFVAWELTSVSSYLLIGHDHQRSEARRAALRALLVTAAGGLAMLVGLLMLGDAAGTRELSVLARTAEGLKRSDVYAPALALVCLGAFTKSAQFPFHFWLPGAMAAPTPVSAYLHSATMVKAGIYLLARLSPALGGTPAWEFTLGLTGATTMVLGALLALGRDDLKQILAYTTVSALGALVMLLGFSTELGATAAVAYLIVHALYKGPLFHVAGIVDHETGTRSLERLGGLGRAMPITAAIAAAAALSMIGLPSTLGAAAKGAMHAAEAEAPVAHLWIAAAAFVTDVATAAIALLLAGAVFWRRRREAPREPHEAPLAMWVGAAAAVGVALWLGASPNGAFGRLVAAAAAVIVPGSEAQGALHAAPMSSKALAWGMGALIAWRRAALLRPLPTLGRAARFGPSTAFDAGIAWLQALAGAATRVIQSGYLRRYVFVVLLATVVLAGTPLVLDQAAAPSLASVDVRLHELAVVAAMIVAAGLCASTESRLAAVVTLGVVGVGVALLFMILGGPDLAMTQLAIETLSVVLFVFVLYRLPRFAHFTTAVERRRDLALSVTIGLLFTAILWVLASVGDDSALSTYFAQQSVPEGKGRNVVNVILVDFRGLDTMGEVAVLAVAAMGVHGLIRLGGRRAAGTGGGR
jgi:multicomponent Na+:H+ antiporter subunit A